MALSSIFCFQTEFGQQAIIQFDTSLVDGAAIDAFYALTSDTKVIPETEANSNGATVELVALGALELTINDKESGDVISLDGGIEMLVPLDPGLNVKDGNDVSIWTYNETTGKAYPLACHGLSVKGSEHYW